jgi:RimJ/RimL family protein N-acetyltransferase
LQTATHQIGPPAAFAQAGGRFSVVPDMAALSPFELADARTVLEWDADREIQHWYDWPLTPPADDPDTYPARLASAERTVVAGRESWAKGAPLSFVIPSVATGESLGWIDLQPRGSGRGNVSYGILARHRGRGAATRAVKLVTRYAFDVLGWARLEISPPIHGARRRHPAGGSPCARNRISSGRSFDARRPRFNGARRARGPRRARAPCRRAR